VVVEGGPGLGVLALDPGRHPSAGGVTLRTAITPPTPKTTVQTLDNTSNAYLRRDSERGYILSYRIVRWIHLYTTSTCAFLSGAVGRQL
jgi:hypothetical protein